MSKKINWVCALAILLAAQAVCAKAVVDPIEACSAESPVQVAVALGELSEGQLTSRREWLLATRDSPATAVACADLIDRARAAVSKGIVRRPYALSDLETSRLTLNPNAEALDDAEARRQFSLAYADSSAGAVLSLELPIVAAAYTLTEDKSFKAHVLEQIEELVSWAPLQRAGWTLRSRKDALPEGGDGVWLATGWLIRGLADTIVLLPNDTLPETLQLKVESLMVREIQTITEDWVDERPWYVKQEQVNSNQWVVPVEGLIRACLIVGPERYPDAYELGVASMQRSLDAQGSLGEFTEGLTYASITVRSMISAARAMEEAGDTRLSQHPFLKNTGTWFVHHIQPGGFLVNAFDVLNASRGQLSIFGNVFAQIGLYSGNTDTLWATQHWSLAGNSIDYMIAQARVAGESLEAPIPWAYYPVGTRVVWRNDWTPEASGVWLRGGGATDFHDHADRGHVNFIIGDKPVLIEAGRPPYGTADEERLYTGLAGHNVLQVGAAVEEDRSIRRQMAPVEVHSLGAAGGDVSIDASLCYPEAEVWQRRVIWDSSRMTVNDEVVLNTTEVILFRWHTGESMEAPVHIEGNTVIIGQTRFDFSSEQELSFDVVSMPDATRYAKELNYHRCVVVSTLRAVTQAKIQADIYLIDSFE
ncbi:heparinase II/III domain-containing protein [Coraliomargarita sp. W4R72]